MVLVTFQSITPKAVSETCGGKPHPQREKKPLSAGGHEKRSLKRRPHLSGYPCTPRNGRRFLVPGMTMSPTESIKNMVIVPVCEVRKKAMGNHGTLVRSLVKLVS